jgi:hypothetical protein
MNLNPGFFLIAAVLLACGGSASTSPSSLPTAAPLARPSSLPTMARTADSASSFVDAAIAASNAHDWRTVYGMTTPEYQKRCSFEKLQSLFGVADDARWSGFYVTDLKLSGGSATFTAHNKNADLGIADDTSKGALTFADGRWYVSKEWYVLDNCS